MKNLLIIASSSLALAFSNYAYAQIDLKKFSIDPMGSATDLQVAIIDAAASGQEIYVQGQETWNNTNESRRVMYRLSPGAETLNQVGQSVLGENHYPSLTVFNKALFWTTFGQGQDSNNILVYKYQDGQAIREAIVGQNLRWMTANGEYIWVQMASELWYKNDGWQAIAPPPDENELWSFVPDHKNNAWVSTPQGKIFMFGDGRWDEKTHGLITREKPNLQHRALTVGQDNTIWILESAFTVAFLEPGVDNWIGLDNGDLSNFLSSPLGGGRTILADSLGNLWIHGKNGLAVIRVNDPSQRTFFEFPPDRVRHIRYFPNVNETGVLFASIGSGFSKGQDALNVAFLPAFGVQPLAEFSATINVENTSGFGTEDARGTIMVNTPPLPAEAEAEMEIILGDSSYFALRKTTQTEFAYDVSLVDSFSAVVRGRNVRGNETTSWKTFTKFFGSQGPEDPEVPTSFALHQNYPNPFNPQTTILVELSQEATVTLVVYNLLGHAVRTLADETLPAGAHPISWDGTNDAGQWVPNGVYLYRLKAGDFTATRRMLLLK